MQGPTGPCEVNFSPLYTFGNCDVFGSCIYAVKYTVEGIWSRSCVQSLPAPGPLPLDAQQNRGTSSLLLGAAFPIHNRNSAPFVIHWSCLTLENR